jgi:hypothetical protein
VRTAARRVLLGAAAVILCAAAEVVVLAIGPIASGATAAPITAASAFVPAAVRAGSLGWLVAVAAVASGGSLVKAVERRASLG